MLLVYDSLTGHIQQLARYLAGQTGIAIASIKALPPILPQQRLLLLTRSQELGKVTPASYAFCQQYQQQIIGIAVGGNRNWGMLYGKAGDLLSQEFHIPLVSKFEISGTTTERAFLVEYIQQQLQLGAIHGS